MVDSNQQETTTAAAGQQEFTARLRQSPLEFWYREIDASGQEFGLDRFKGFHDGHRLVLGVVEIPDSCITDVAREDERLHLSWVDLETGQPEQATLRVYKRAAALKQAIDFGLSRRRFQAQLERQAAGGMGHACRSTICTHCQAQVFTFEPVEFAPQVYCGYCDALNTTIEVPGLNDVEKDYRICGRCGMYSRPQWFSITYFYFLVFHAGVHHKAVYCCAGCMRRSAWLMLLGNLPFLLGFPYAVVQFIRVYRDTNRRGIFARLDVANLLMQRGKIEPALEEYGKIIERHPVSAGVLFNIAVGLVKQGDYQAAQRTLEMAVENCSNYLPAQQMLSDLVNQTWQATARPFDDVAVAEGPDETGAAKLTD